MCFLFLGGQNLTPKRRYSPLLILFCLFSFPVLSGGADNVIVGCIDSEKVHVVCGINAPEDLAAVPDSPYIIISQFGDMGKSRGGIVLFDTEQESFTPLLSPGETPDVSDKALWGSKDCNDWGDKFFSPHGIDIYRRASGELALLVSNHDQRDSIEYFELITGSNGLALEWRGCVMFSEREMLNDVVATSNDGFFTTTMFDKTEPAINGMNRALAEAFSSLKNSGHVIAWTPESGIRIVDGTASPAPNGIEASPDGSVIYLNVYPAGEVRKIDAATGNLLGKANVTGPDNVTWGDDGLLYVASHVPYFPGETSACHGAEQGSCAHPFHVVTIAPETMQSSTVFRQDGVPFGAATVAVKAGDAIYLGSFIGNRIAKISLSSLRLNGQQ